MAADKRTKRDWRGARVAVKKSHQRPTYTRTATCGAGRCRFQPSRSFTALPQRRQVSGPGASGDWRIKPTSLLDDDADPRFPAFQQAWQQGADLGELFGPNPFALHGIVAPSGGDNTRPHVAKVQTLLGKIGYLDLGQDGPSGYANPATDTAIRKFQKDKGLTVDGVLKPGGPTITALGGLLGGSTPASPGTAGMAPDRARAGTAMTADASSGLNAPFRPPPRSSIIRARVRGSGVHEVGCCGYLRRRRL